MPQIYITICDCIDAVQIDQGLMYLLPNCRTERVSKFRQHSDKVRCFTAGLLSTVTASNYFNRPFNEVSVITKQGVAPYALNNEKKKVYLSISHSGDYVLCMADNKSCGIDIEFIKCDNNNIDIAKSFFNPLEYEFLKSITDSYEQTECFFKIWTLKEAYLKYLGCGLRRELSSFCIINEDGKVLIRDPENASSEKLCCNVKIHNNYSIASVSESSVDCVREYSYKELVELIRNTSERENAL